MKYGYGRVSSNGQRLYGTSLEKQTEQLLEQGISKENIYLDTYTGTKMERPKLEQVTSLLQPGDELVICRLDRLARTAAEGSILIRDLVNQGVKVNILNMGIADNTPMGKVLVTIMLAFAEFERDMIVERTSMGKEYAKEHKPGFREGRPRKEILINRLENETVTDACRRLGISRTQWYRHQKAKVI